MSLPVGGGEGAVGEILGGKYRLVRLIGQGGMGTVYEAQHAVVGRRFAVKLLHPELASDGGALERFSREAQAAGSLESENIASAVDFGYTDRGVPYIVMELLVGEDVAKLLAREGVLPVTRAVRLAVDTCRGLDAAHAAGVIHRDLKPENLFLCRRADGSDHLKILDFGIAKLARQDGDNSVGLTRTGSTMGTPLYMAPEQARGEKDLDHRADIYALGVILYEALTGQNPHPGDSYNAILYHILTQEPRRAETLRPGLPQDLADAIHQALASRPADRPPSAMAFARALSPHAGRQVTPLRSHFEFRAARGPGDSTESHVAVERAVTPVAPNRSKRRVAMFGVAAALATLAVASVIGLLSREEASEPIGSGSDVGSNRESTKSTTAEAPANHSSPTQVAAPAESGATTPGLAGDGGVSAQARTDENTPARRTSPPPVRRKTGRAPSSRPDKPAAVFDETNPYK